MAPSHLVYAHLDRMRTQLNEMDMAYGPDVGLTRVEMHGMHGMG